MTGMRRAELAEDTVRARAILEEGLATPVQTLAYPYGAENEFVRRVIADLGFQAAVSCEPGISRLGDDPLRLPRIEVPGGAHPSVCSQRLILRQRPPRQLWGLGRVQLHGANPSGLRPDIPLWAPLRVVVGRQKNVGAGVLLWQPGLKGTRSQHKRHLSRPASAGERRGAFRSKGAGL